MTLAAAVFACLILLALAVFQLLLIGGRPIGRFAWGGQHDVLPRNLRIGSMVSIVLYAVFMVVILERAGVTNVFPDAVAQVGIWVLTAYFALGILLNGISRSKPERNLMTPVCIVLAGLCLLIAVS
ncbi:hypothetical protein D9V29_01830 [Mycetocola manganoxydans]|uniref:Uncharacterized protein n=1 Tax=Mycetocola manganoxydans TaxID=699879 RepID=A0A3L7A0E6_9MICO|nr:hypothetical protein [Mycetocola manganoxydans]RLP73450.1 hypothetical protein D9V29_01830 [Mycetocola manganoxydans]GHD41654.1 hypothetical protein GCM10008097_06630 [Mycetocola manganoxydans]